MKKLVLSLFNGMNCIGLALDKNQEEFQIYASEIEKMLTCGVSDSQLYKMLGNGWTVEVIAYILKFLHK